MWEKIEKLIKEKGLTKNKLATLAGINKNINFNEKYNKKTGIIIINLV